jgi:Asp/Glu/hydantoin racemase
MKILVVNVPTAEENSVKGKFIKNSLAPLWRRDLDLFKNKETELTFRFSCQGILDHSFPDSFYLSHFDPEFLLRGVLQADQEGFDAALITCFHDAPTLKAARPLVSIPLVGIAESILITAALTGRKFGFVGLMADPDHPNLERKKEMELWIAQYDLNKNYIGDMSRRVNGKEIEAAFTDSHEVIEKVKEASKELIKKGAEIILPAGGLLPPILHLAPGAEKEYPHGLTDVDGVPLMNSMGIALKMAEMLVNSKPAGFKLNKQRDNNSNKVAGVANSKGYWNC